MLAATAGLTALHGLSAAVQYLLVDGPSDVAVMAYVISPLTAAVAIAAVVMVLRPSTGHWCRHAEGSE
ncbi:hypothetical protein ACIHJG_31105 [Streptomyces sp. NPDC052415]|uniref:hypothetical protein n=1 Tax=Streptomyces sp. NPDC052415 TaxID=3365690 RepID=UPI0037CFD235